MWSSKVFFDQIHPVFFYQQWGVMKRTAINSYSEEYGDGNNTNQPYDRTVYVVNNNSNLLVVVYTHLQYSGVVNTVLCTIVPWYMKIIIEYIDL